MYFNGKQVAQASDTAMPQDKDVTALLRSGENMIAAHVVHQRADTPAGLIGAVKIEFESGEPLLIQSGTQWRAAAKVEAGWEKPGYLDTAWQAAKVLGPYGMAPWKEAGYLEAHRLPARMLRKEFAVDKKVRRATVYFSGLGVSEFYLNGAKVGDAVLSSRPHRLRQARAVRDVRRHAADCAGPERHRRDAGQRPLLCARARRRQSARATSAIPRRSCNSMWSTRTAAA